MGLEFRFSFKVCASISVCPDRMTSECVKLLYSRGGNVVELAFSGEHAAAWAAACAGDEIGNKLFDLLESFRGATAAECLAQPAGQSTPGLLAADNLSASARSGQQTKASPSGSSMAERQAASEARQSLPRERRRSDPDEEPATGTGAPRGGSVAGAWARVDAARMERAHEAGTQAARKLAGGIKAVPKTPPPVGGELRPRCYVVLRALQPEAKGSTGGGGLPMGSLGRHRLLWSETPREPRRCFTGSHRRPKRVHTPQPPRLSGRSFGSGDMVCQLSNLPQATAASRYFTLEVPVGLFAAQGSVCGSSVSGHHEKRLMYSTVQQRFCSTQLVCGCDLGL